MSFTNPAWVDPIEATFDEGKPIRSEQGLMLAGNPISIAQGTSNAPIMVSALHPYNKAYVGDSADGVIYDYSVDGSVGSIETPLFDDGYDYALYVEDLVGTNNSVSLDVYHSNSTWITIKDLSASSNNNTFNGWLFLRPLPTNLSRHLTGYSPSGFYAKTLNLTTQETIIEPNGGFGSANIGPVSINKARLNFSGIGNASAGKVFLYRRRNYGE